MKTITTAVGWACLGTYLALTFAWAAALELAPPASPPVSVESQFQAAGRHGDGWLGPGDHTRTVTVGPATRRYTPNARISNQRVDPCYAISHVTSFMIIAAAIRCRQASTRKTGVNPSEPTQVPMSLLLINPPRAPKEPEMPSTLATLVRGNTSETSVVMLNNHTWSLTMRAKTMPQRLRLRKSSAHGICAASARPAVTSAAYAGEGER